MSRADEHRRSEQRAVARRKLAAVRARARRIRRGVVAFALGLFLLAFAGIYAQLATGHDPALSKDAHKGAETRTQASSSSRSEAQSSESSKSESSQPSESDASTSPSTVRTSQS
jgi:hypothetical protein